MTTETIATKHVVAQCIENIKRYANQYNCSFSEAWEDRDMDYPQPITEAVNAWIDSVEVKGDE